MNTDKCKPEAESFGTVGGDGDDDVRARLDVLAGYDHVVLAVSGGSDSMALMLLAEAWARHRMTAAPGVLVPRLSVATVDHGLRPESAAEAEAVGEAARALGLDHACLVWSGSKPGAKPRTGVQSAARAARYALLGDHIAQLAPDGRRALVTAHTLDDQVETFLMRLARGSSLDGVAAMRTVRRLSPFDATDLLRPLLAVPRSALRALLAARGVRWIDDPSNADTAFERVRLRQAQPALKAVGLDTRTLALTVQRLAGEREALDALAAEWLREHASAHRPGLWIALDEAALKAAPRAFGVRALRRAMAATGAGPKDAGLTVVEAVLARLHDAPIPHQETAGGCLLRVEGGTVWIAREPPRQMPPPAIVACTTPGVCIWDNRLRIAWPAVDTLAITVTSEAQAVDVPAIVRPAGVPHPIWAAARQTAPVVTLASVAAPDAAVVRWRALEAIGFDALIAIPPPLHAHLTAPGTPPKAAQIRLSGRLPVAPAVDPIGITPRFER